MIKFTGRLTISTDYNTDDYVVTEEFKDGYVVIFRTKVLSEAENILDRLQRARRAGRRSVR
jgi:hypothetical protein